MRILHVIEAFDRETGGPPPVVTGMCDALAARGHQVSLYANRCLNPYKNPGETGYELRLFDVDFAPFGFSRAMARALRTEIKRFDIVHLHMIYRFPQLAASHYARAAGVPYCIQPHGALVSFLYNNAARRLPRRLYTQIVEQYNFRHAAGIVFTAEPERENARALGFSADRSYIVPVGAHVADLARTADPGAFRRKYGLENREVLLWMGRLVPKKALDVLIPAFARIAERRPGATLVLVGPDTEGYGEQVRGWVRDAGLESRVVFTGMLVGEEKQQAFHAADLFVFPSHAENFGVVILEAMAVGVPVILSRGIDIWRDIEATGAAAIVDSEVQDVATAVLDLLENAPRRHALGEAGKKAAWRYDWSVIGDELETAYRDMTR